MQKTKFKIETLRAEAYPFLRGSDDPFEIPDWMKTTFGYALESLKLVWEDVMRSRFYKFIYTDQFQRRAVETLDFWCLVNRSTGMVLTADLKLLMVYQADETERSVVEHTLTNAETKSIRELYLRRQSKITNPDTDVSLIHFSHFSKDTSLKLLAYYILAPLSASWTGLHRNAELIPTVSDLLKAPMSPIWMWQLFDEKLSKEAAESDVEPSPGIDEMEKPKDLFIGWPQTGYKFADALLTHMWSLPKPKI